MLDAYETACTGSLSWLSLSRVGYNVWISCFNFNPENSDTVGLTVTFWQVR